MHGDAGRATCVREGTQIHEVGVPQEASNGLRRAGGGAVAVGKGAWCLCKRCSAWVGKGAGGCMRGTVWVGMCMGMAWVVKAAQVQGGA